MTRVKSSRPSTQDPISPASVTYKNIIVFDFSTLYFVVVKLSTSYDTISDWVWFCRSCRCSRGKTSSLNSRHRPHPNVPPTDTQHSSQVSIEVTSDTSLSITLESFRYVIEFYLLPSAFVCTASVGARVRPRAATKSRASTAS